MKQLNSYLEYHDTMHRVYICCSLASRFSGYVFCSTCR